MESYALKQGREEIGTVKVHTDGLYLSIYCSCELCGEVMYNLMMQSSGTNICLGLLSVNEDFLSLRKKISVKKAGEGPFHFYLCPRHQKIQGRLRHSVDGSPYNYISGLEERLLLRKKREKAYRSQKENNAKKHEISA